MRIRSKGLFLLAGLSIAASACGGTTPSPGATTPATQGTNCRAHHGRRNGLALEGSAWCTDVGTINDKNFNQYSYAGAMDGAAAIGAEKPPYIVPKDVRGYCPPGSRRSSTRVRNIIVVNGFNAGPRRQVRQGEPGGLVHRRRPDPCIEQRACDAEGDVDTTFACIGVTRDPAAQLHRAQLPGGSGRLPRGDGRRHGNEERHHRRRRWCHPVRTVRPLHAGLRPWREVDQPGHHRSRSAWVTESDFTRASTTRLAGKTFGHQFIPAEQGHRRRLPGRRPDRQRRRSTQPAQPASVPSASTSTSTSRTRPRGLHPDQRREAPAEVRSRPIEAIAAGTAKGG